MDDLLAEFIAETLETLDALSSEVVAWESDPTDRERLDAFFRFFHTVKGSCGFLNLPRFERLSHSAEDVLAAIRNGDRRADSATITAVLAVMDRIGALARGLGEEEAIPEKDDDALLDALVAAPSFIEIFEDSPAPAAPASEGESAEGEPAAKPRGREKGLRTIRLPLSLIDQLMNGVSDMVLARNELSRKMRALHADPEIESSFERLSANVADLRDMISKTRMQRVDRLYAAIPRMVRDLSRDLGKKAVVELDGGDVEMDREMIEMVVDPLTHIVRNALDHGIETPAERAAAGKPEVGKLRLVARQSGNQIVIEISDDGRGIDRAALVEKAVASGVLGRADAARLDEQAQVNLIFHAGLSTARSLTAISGRGVGMDVVRANVEQIGGVIGIESQPGRGTAITMRVPLTLTIIPGLIITCAGQSFAIPRGNVVELLHENSGTVRVETVGGARIAVIRGQRHSMIDLEDVLGIVKHREDGPPRTLLVVRSSVGLPYVLGVEAVESNEELVIRPASPLVAMAGLYAGMTLPDNGQPMLLLDAAGIAQASHLPLADADNGPLPAAAGKAEEEAQETVAALHYVERSGEHRLMPLHVIDRVEDIPSGYIGQSSGRFFVTLEDEIVPAINGEGLTGETVKALRLRAAGRTYYYLIQDVIDIVDAPPAARSVGGGGIVAGPVIVDGQVYDLVDPYMLFSLLDALGVPEPIGRAGRHCLLCDGDDGWMRAILAPLLRRAGHSVAFSAHEGAEPDVVLLSGDGEALLPVTDLRAPVLRLRDTPAPAPGEAPSLYRYDREGLFEALARITPRRAA